MIRQTSIVQMGQGSSSLMRAALGSSDCSFYLFVLLTAALTDSMALCCFVLVVPLCFVYCQHVFYRSLINTVQLHFCLSADFLCRSFRAAICYNSSSPRSFPRATSKWGRCPLLSRNSKTVVFKNGRILEKFLVNYYQMQLNIYAKNDQQNTAQKHWWTAWDLIFQSSQGQGNKAEL